MARRSSLNKSFPLVMIFLLLCVPSWAMGEEWQGRVVRVQDGDSLKVKGQKGLKVIRLKGVDAPEKGQPYANEARDFVRQKVWGRRVLVVEKGWDHYGRTLAELFLPDGQSINQEIVASGWAWRHIAYSRDPILKGLEREARGRGLGLWADKNPVPPWVWKEKKRKRGR